VADVFASVNVHFPKWLYAVSVPFGGDVVSLDVLAVGIIALMSLVMLLGTKASSMVNMAITVLNVAVILTVIM